MLDQRTDTLYVTNGNDNTVSVIGAARCNAEHTRGCGRAVVATVKVGKFPVQGALNPATRTLYIANLTGSISVINAATCNAQIPLEVPPCGMPDKADPAWIDVHAATDTVYAANSGPSGDGSTVSVIDGPPATGTPAGPRAHTGHHQHRPHSLPAGG